MAVLLFRLTYFFNDTATTEIYTLSLHDAFPISIRSRGRRYRCCPASRRVQWQWWSRCRSNRSRLGSHFVRVEHGSKCLIPVPRSADILQAFRLQKELHLLDAFVDGARRHEAQGVLRLFAAHSIIPRVLERHGCLVDDQVGEMVSYLIGKIDNANILPVKIEHAGCGCCQVVDGRLGGISDVEQRAELVSAEDTDSSFLGGTHGERVHNQIQPHTRKLVAHPKERSEAENDRILALEVLFGSKFRSRIDGKRSGSRVLVQHHVILRSVDGAGRHENDAAVEIGGQPVHGVLVDLHANVRVQLTCSVADQSGQPDDGIRPSEMLLEASVVSYVPKYKVYRLSVAFFVEKRVVNSTIVAALLQRIRYRTADIASAANH